MISFSNLDIIIILGFIFITIAIGFIASKKSQISNANFLLSGRKVGLLLFILTNVATWYGGILGVGEFSYRYGLASWFTQGLPYYIFAFLFALFFAEKINSASLFTIPDKLNEVYGKKVSLISAFLIFILVSPAPYLLMLAQIISIIFNINYLISLFISAVIASIYLFKGGYNSNIWADAFSFVVMFIGFILIIVVANNKFGNFTFLLRNLPENHLNMSGGMPITFSIVWFLIALWTFTDPGFHQRCYSAKNGKVAKRGIIISIFFWLFFDFLTNTTGLYSRAILPNLENPVLAFPMLAENILTTGFKGIFFAALIATVLSTLNSFVFLSATTFSRDFIYRLVPQKTEIGKDDSNLIKFTQLGIIVTLIISICISYFFQSVVELWYLIGSICIPGILLIVVSSYYQKIKVSSNFAIIEIIFGALISFFWFLIRDNFAYNNFLSQIEPMIFGLLVALIIHLVGYLKRKNFYIRKLKLYLFTTVKRLITK
jgi:SSS family solute:Na+ symporter